MYSQIYLDFQLENIWLFDLTIILTLAIVLTISYYPEITRQVPINYFILILFTLCEYYSVSIICGRVEPNLVFMDAFLTFGLVISLTVYAASCKEEFTVQIGVYVTLVYTFLFIIILLLFNWFTLAYLLGTALLVILYGIIFIIDTEKVLGKHYRQSFEFTIDD
jgi:FtsH-binding integral membrane protein